MNVNAFKILLVVVLALVGNALIAQSDSKVKYFKNIKAEIPSVLIDLRYCGENNFIGKPIDGYHQPIAYLSKPAIVQLKKVQAALMLEGRSLKIYDAYRPQRAVNCFVSWAKNESDTLMKRDFYPDVAKKDLFRLEYIVEKSGHSRGSTIDLTIVDLKTGKELDMGSSYDFFGGISWPFYAGITPDQKANRMLLRNIMLAHNFKPYKCEWWHFTLKNEPFPNTYFDFPID